MRRKILIVGTGSHGKVILGILRRLNFMKEQILFADIFHKRFDSFMGCKVIGGLDESIRIDENSVDAIVAYGGTPYEGNINRQLATEKLVQNFREQINFISVVDPSSVIDETAIIEKNVSIGAHAFINTDAKISQGSIINSGAIIEHDVVVGEYSNISPGAVVLGLSKVGRRVFIGGGAVIRNNIEIGDGSVIGMGAIVTKDVPPKSLVIGNPGTILPL